MLTPPEALPVLGAAEALEWERGLLREDPALEFAAIQAAAAALVAELERDFEELAPFPAEPRILIAAGKGHNGADALLAASLLAKRHPLARFTALLASPVRELRPLTLRALQAAQSAAGQRLIVRSAEEGSTLANLLDTRWHILLDGLLGIQFRPPLADRLAEVVRLLNDLRVHLRAAVDLPSGLHAGSQADPTAAVARADFTYATGCAKQPVADPANAHHVGRLRVLDLGFFSTPPGSARERWGRHPHTAQPCLVSRLSALRPQTHDKVAAGHVLVVAGSRRYPGTALLATLGALHGGAGLVTTALPESLHAAFAARAPEAMWTALPETQDGALALEGLGLLLPHLARAHALVVGPGLGSEAETTALVVELVRRAECPVLLDADALRPPLLEAVAARRHATVLTPHHREWERLRAGTEQDDCIQRLGTDACVLLKGPISRLLAASRPALLLPAGGPVLARGGNGDLLAGLLGALLADRSLGRDLPDTIAAGVVWAGLAADALARSQGQRSAPTTALLVHLAPTLRSRALD